LLEMLPLARLRWRLLNTTAIAVVFAARALADAAAKAATETP
jgi:hypothetical protein